ncbi:efflux RND transporter periplasmic adaptor subunit [Bacteroidota bacterium]
MKKVNIIILIFITFTAILISCNKKEKVQESAETIKIKTTKVQEVNYNHQIISSGKIVSNEESKLSFKTGSVINAIHFNEGDYVKKGQVLATLKLSEINAMVNQAKLALEKSKRDYERAKNLYEDSVATLEQFQDATTGLEYAKTNVEIAEFNLKYSSINAPSDGVILKKLAEENELIGQGYPVFLFGSGNEKWILKTNVADKDAVLIEIGDEATVSIDAYPNNKFNAKVVEVGKFADPYTGTYEIELEIDPGKKKLVSGLIAKVNISTKKSEKFILVPYISLIEANENEGFIYKIVNDEIKKITIKIAKMIDEGILVISNGLQPNDVIVTEGVNYIKPGSNFEIVK